MIGNEEPRHLPVADTPEEHMPVPNESAVERPRMARWRELLLRMLLRADARSRPPYGIPAHQVHHVDVPIER